MRRWGEFAVTRGACRLDFFSPWVRGAVRVMTRATPQLPMGSACTLALGKLFDLTGGDDFMVVFATNESIGGETVFGFSSRLEVRPIFTWIQDTPRTFEMTLFANAVAKRAAQFCRIQNVLFRWVSDMFLGWAMTAIAGDRIQVLDREMAAIGIIELGSAGMTVQAGFRDAAAEFEDP